MYVCMYVWVNLPAPANEGGQYGLDFFLLTDLDELLNQPRSKLAHLAAAFASLGGPAHCMYVCMYVCIIL